jgi:hypothetical protein
MLQELIKISEKNNIVIYATHSIFMIDRLKYERHVYLKKVNECTSIKPSKKDRIGFFMQEEVLYGAVNVNLYQDFKSTNQYNFVFEGEGDARIFEYLYSKLAKKDMPFELDNCSFHQGGKCSNITKYLKQNPIQLGSKWVFILDNDQPANNLKNFIESRYRDYLEMDIFIFQYCLEENSEKSIELEDILSKKRIKEAYQSTFIEFDSQIQEEELDKLILGNYGDYSKEILNKLNLQKTQETLFISNFKDNLNKKIIEELSGLKKLNDFKESFKDYSSWALKIIEALQKNVQNN